MTIYAESSAFAAWLLGEAEAETVHPLLRQAGRVAASELTLIECDRAILRAELFGTVDAPSKLRDDLQSASSDWTILAQSPAVVQRTRERLPVEPVRTLDALHLAFALSLMALGSEVAILSLDRRVRENGAALGLRVLPS